MKKKQFVKNYDYAPFELTDFAEGASDVEDCDELVQAGQNFLAAKQNLIAVMLKHGVEIG